jgi:hypothetical protein
VTRGRTARRSARCSRRRSSRRRRSRSPRPAARSAARPTAERGTRCRARRAVAAAPRGPRARRGRSPPRRARDGECPSRRRPPRSASRVPRPARRTRRRGSKCERRARAPRGDHVAESQREWPEGGAHEGREQSAATRASTSNTRSSWPRAARQAAQHQGQRGSARACFRPSGREPCRAASSSRRATDHRCTMPGHSRTRTGTAPPGRARPAATALPRRRSGRRARGRRGRRGNTPPRPARSRSRICASRPCGVLRNARRRPRLSSRPSTSPLTNDACMPLSASLIRASEPRTSPST